METYALIGASGTGKSHNAIRVAKECQIDVIIDDGLLIKDGKKIAGVSAKTKPTMMGAVKCAIFNDPKHAKEVRDKIKQIQPKRVLILGTSEKMIHKIVDVLELPPLKQKIFIQEIATPEQMELAKKMREDGKHVIPLPSIEVKKDLPSYWLDSLVGLFSKKDSNTKTDNEKSIIRPQFSQLGTLTIADSVISQIVQHCIGQFAQLDKNAKVSVAMHEYGVNIYCEMKVKYGVAIQEIVEHCQKKIIEILEELTGLNVLKIDMRVSGIVM